MGRGIRAAAGAAALFATALGCTEAALGAESSARVLEAEYMSATGGGMVRDRGAANGRVLALRPGGEGRREVRLPQLEAVVVRARARNCRRAPLRVRADGTSWSADYVTRRWSEQRVELPLAAGDQVLRVRFGSGYPGRCRLHVDRLELVAAPVATPPGGGPAPPPTPRRRVPLGSSVIVDKLFGDGAYSAALDRHFTSVTPENELKMEWLQPEEGRFNFSAADRLVDYASARGMEVRGHALIFGSQTPPWVARKAFPEELERAMREHIHSVVRRYAGRIGTWDVVNEAFTDSGRFRYNPFFEKFGSRYVEMAFRYARQADPSARLVYNEISAERAGAKRTAMFGMVKSLREKGLIDGVGFQVHTAIGHEPKQEDLVDTFKLFESLGVDVEITEMDVLARGDAREDSLARRLAWQADVYRSAATACAVVLACKKFTVWGVGDRYSWRGAEQMPLLLDTDFNRKPALDAVLGVIG